MNDVNFTIKSELDKYKYQYFIKKRYEKLKNMFVAMPVRMKKVERVVILLWLYYVVFTIDCHAPLGKFCNCWGVSTVPYGLT